MTESFVRPGDLIISIPSQAAKKTFGWVDRMYVHLVSGKSYRIWSAGAINEHRLKLYSANSPLGSFVNKGEQHFDWSFKVIRR